MDVKIVNVNVRLNGRRILKDVSLHVKSGELFGIIGENGCGKTTLLRCIAKYYSKEGTLYLDGRELDEMRVEELAKILGVVPQEFEINLRFTVENFVSLGRIPYIRLFESERDKEIVRRVLSMLGCDGSRIVGTLSGGEKQRVLIAKALAQEPRILLLDEPTSHLDLRHQLEIMKVLRFLSRRGLTVISTFHDLSLAINFCDRIAVMKDGRILNVCKPSEMSGDIVRRAFGIDADVLDVRGWKVVVPRV